MSDNIQKILDRLVKNLKVSSDSNVQLRSSHATLCFGKSRKLVDPMEETNCLDMKAEAVTSRMTRKGKSGTISFSTGRLHLHGSLTGYRGRD